MTMELIETSYRAIVEKWRAEQLGTREQLAAALEDFRIRQAYHSGRIENQQITYHDTRDVFEDGRAVGYTGDVRTLFEIQNLRECHELMLDHLAERSPISVPFVLELHRTLTQGTYDERRWGHGERPGTFKQGDYVVGAGDRGITAREVPQAMEDLIGELRAANPSNALLVAAYFHLSFEAIHPFADGNGRCGRALMNYLLMLHDHPPVIIFEDDRLAYYGALDIWDEDADLEPMMEFLKAELVKTWRHDAAN